MHLYIKGWQQQPTETKKVYTPESIVSQIKGQLETIVQLRASTYRKDETGFYRLKTEYTNPFPKFYFDNSVASLLKNFEGFQVLYDFELSVSSLVTLREMIIDSEQSDKFSEFIHFIDFAISENRSIYLH